MSILIILHKQQMIMNIIVCVYVCVCVRVYRCELCGLYIYTKLNLLKTCGRLAMTGPYPAELSYNSNSGAATSL